jgi:hypothetical protein
LTHARTRAPPGALERAQHVGQVLAVAHAPAAAQLGRFALRSLPMSMWVMSASAALMAWATCASTPLPFHQHLHAGLEGARGLLGPFHLHPALAVALEQALATWQSAVCTTRPSPRPR